MSVKHGLLALLAEEPMGVYRLRKEFEARTGGSWPINIGQVYSTVQRLERDGLVVRIEDSADDVDRFESTPAGREQASAWWSTPVSRGDTGRDELVIKLALAVSAVGVDVRDIVQAQRSETMRAMRDFTRLKAQVPSLGDRITRPELAWSLVLDHHTFTAEAEVRWLDHIEASVARAVITPSSDVDADQTTADRSDREISR
ncbi:PadR family transcriptional regulator [Pseudactinotalea sp.]|uniref:PadR family transcriptional regulator n=1 Tax=Pseudactinotalea sp. TaxID=1926260 RepID=UPI003B3A7A1E